MVQLLFSLCLSDDLSKRDSTFAPFLKLALLLKEFYKLSTIIKAGTKL